MDNISHVSRFLQQATLGADQQLLNDVQQKGMKVWLNEQLNEPPVDPKAFELATREIWQFFKQRLQYAHGAAAINGDGNNPALPYKWYFHMAWWQHALNYRQDLLRQRVALALSEILVISDNSALELNAIGMANYYDLLYRNAFGNYADLLYEVSTHPMMGIYLTHMNNRKANPAKRIHPDENYAREIMQLFSIGLFELNQNGTEKKDGAGNPIPTYDNRDIKELARVFTGIQADSYFYEWNTSFFPSSLNGSPVEFDDGVEKQFKTVPFIDAAKPMKVDENYHDRGPKRLLNGHINLPGGQTGAQEIREVCNKLVSHPSTAPFVARHMINRLVTSNPSKAYVRAVARAFGTSGNLKAMIRTLLTYPMDKRVASKNLPGSYEDETGKRVQSQRLKSPIERTTQLLLAFKAYNNSGRMWLLGDDIQDALQQHPLSAPTVFNFYKPDYTPHGEIEDRNLVAPEFEIHTSSTSVGYVNQLYWWLLAEYLPIVSTRIGSTEDQKMVMEMDPETLWADNRNKLRLDLRQEINQARNPANHDALIDRLGLLLTGRPTLKIKPRIKNAISTFPNNPKYVVQTIIFMIAISPEFSVHEV